MITIPMFILMAMFIAETRLGSDLMMQLINGLVNCAEAGGATITACGLMGAVTGGSVLLLR